MCFLTLLSIHPTRLWFCYCLATTPPPPPPQNQTKHTAVLPKKTDGPALKSTQHPCVEWWGPPGPGVAVAGWGEGWGCRLLSGALLPPTVCQAVCTGGEPERQRSEKGEWPPPVLPPWARCFTSLISCNPFSDLDGGVSWAHFTAEGKVQHLPSQQRSQEAVQCARSRVSLIPSDSSGDTRGHLGADPSPTTS